MLSTEFTKDDFADPDPDSHCTVVALIYDMMMMRSLAGLLVQYDSLFLYIIIN